MMLFLVIANAKLVILALAFRDPQHSLINVLDKFI